MSALNPLALTYESVLRALATTPDKPWTLSSLAGAAGKDKSTLRRALPAMREADLLGPEPDFTLGDAGRAALALLDGEPEQANAVRDDAPLGFVAIKHALIVPDALNPRGDFDEAALDELAASIRRDGLLQNLVVRPAEPYEGGPFTMHRLVAGERRWRAIGKLIAAGHWPRDKALPCNVVDLDDTGHAVIALLENLQRRDLKPLEEARAFRRLVDDHKFKTADIADRINATQRVVQQRLQLLELDAADQKRLDEGKLTLEQARQIIANRPKPFNLPADQALMLVEIAHRVAAVEGHWYQDLPIGDATGDDTLQALAKRWLVSWGSNCSTAQWTVSLQHTARRAIAEITGIADPDAAELEGAAAELRLKLPPADLKSVAYSTPWLNPPYAVHTERLAEIDTRKAREATQAEADKARKAKVAEAKKAARTLELGLKKGTLTTSGGELSGAIAELGAVLPVRLKNDVVEDALGRQIMSRSYYGGLPEESRIPLMRLMVLAINAALGFPEPPPPSDDAPAAKAVDDEDGEAFDQDGDDEGECEICGQPIVGGDCPDCAAEDGEADDDLSPAAKKLVGVE